MGGKCHKDTENLVLRLELALVLQKPREERNSPEVVRARDFLKSCRLVPGDVLRNTDEKLLEQQISEDIEVPENLVHRDHEETPSDQNTLLFPKSYNNLRCDNQVKVGNII